jgi:cation diffusion facilitator family transporter
MWQAALTWLGFMPDPAFSHHAGHSHGHGHGHSHGEGGHGHTHGVVDPTIASTAKGIWAIKWSFLILMVTAVAQVAVVLLTNSVGLLADTIHNFGDAATAIPLWIAFLFARRAPSKTFNYGFHRVEDLAGVTIVGLILFSALYAGYESVQRFIDPKPVDYIGVLAIAGLLGFLGNEAVAVFRIRVGRQINSAALIADGYHARVDGFTSLAVVLGAFGVWLGFPLADPIVGIAITVMIFGIVWQSARAVFTRMLDGIEPGLLEEIEHTAEHVPGIMGVSNVKARWLGHRLRAEVDIEVHSTLTVADADRVAQAFESELAGHMPALQGVHVRTRAAA